MGSKNSSEIHSLKQEKKTMKAEDNYPAYIVSGGKCFAIFKVPQKLYGPLSSQNPGLFYLASKVDNSQHLSSWKIPPSRLVGPGISRSIPHGEDNRRYPWLGQSPGGVNGAASEFSG